MNHFCFSTTFCTILMISLAGIAYSQDDFLCQGAFWTEQEANLKMKEFAALWSDKDSWEERAEVIREGIKKGMQWDKMPKEEFPFRPIIHSA